MSPTIDAPLPEAPPSPTIPPVLEAPPAPKAARVASLALLAPAPAPTPPPAPRARRREWYTVPAMLLGTLAAYTVPGIDALLFLGLVFAVPALAVSSVVGFLACAWRAARGHGFGGSWGLDQATAMGLAVVAMAVAGPRDMSPVMLDLNDDGVIGTTQASTARRPLDRRVDRTVRFDLAAAGAPQAIAWSDGGGDAFLVDDRDGGASRAAAGDGVIDGTRLFGDQGGRWASGYDKLATLDADRDGQLAGAELGGLAAWIDDGDARLGRGELQPVAALGITAIAVRHGAVTNGRGEALDRSTFTQHGRRKMTEDVWFGRG